MACGSDRDKGPPEHTQRWAFITLSDFKANSVWPSLAYIWLWIMAVVAIAVYAVDTFTAVNLLAFNKWSSQVQPAIPFKYSKWIFAVCILLSWVLCIYEWFHAIRVIKRGGIAESYMDPLAVTLQSMRPGGGWKRFLVFTELTKSKKGADYVAYFVYFSFNSALRVIICEGPRQFVNAMSLYAVMQADLLTKGDHNNFEQFWINMGALADKDKRQAVILFSMLFTLVIWVISALSLLAAAILYLVFLWHYIPERDGRLKVYCRRKIDRRLEKIVEHTVKAAIEEETLARQRAERKAELKRQKTDLSLASKASKDSSAPNMSVKPLGQVGRQPTLPQLGESPGMNNKQEEFVLQRMDTSTTVSTLPRYESLPPTGDGTARTMHSGMQRQPTLPDMRAERPGMPSRLGTQGSTWSQQSYESDSPLLANAGYAGESGRASPAPGYPRPPPSRTVTQGSGFSQQSQQRPFSPMDGLGPALSRSMTPQGQRPFSPVSNNGSVYNGPPPGPRGPPMRSNTGLSFDTEPRSTVSPITYADTYGRPQRRQGTQESFATAPSMMSRNESQESFSRPMVPQRQPMERRPTYGSQHSEQSQQRELRPTFADQHGVQSSISFSRPFPSQRLQSPPQAEQPTQTEDSYEMQPQPSYTAQQTTRSPSPAIAPSGGYKAVNPAMMGGSTSTPPPPAATPSQLMPGPKGNVTYPGNLVDNGIPLGHLHTNSGELQVPQRSATAPINNRLTTGYADIISDYGESSSRNSISPPALPAPSPETVRGGSPLPAENVGRAATPQSVGSSVTEGLRKHVSSVYSQFQFAGLTHAESEVEPVPTLPRAHTASPAPARHLAPWEADKTNSWERSSENKF